MHRGATKRTARYRTTPLGGGSHGSGSTNYQRGRVWPIIEASSAEWEVVQRKGECPVKTFGEIRMKSCPVSFKENV